MKGTDTITIEHILGRMQADTSLDAPADALKYVKNLFRTRAAKQSVGVIERIAAVLRVDLTPQQAAFGERSGAAGQARQMLFESGDIAVDLRITAVKSGFEVRGQVFGEGFENCDVILDESGRAVSAGANELGEFKLGSVAAGVHTLTLRAGTREFHIDTLPLD